MEGFDNLKGIGKAKDTILSDSFKTLEKMIIITEEALGKRKPGEDIREKLTDLTKGLDITEKDIKDYVSFYSSTSYNREEFMKRLNLGLATGFFFEMYQQKYGTDQNFRFEIDGKNKYFPCLLTHSKFYGEIVIRNFKGNEIGDNITKSYSKDSTLALIDINGNNLCSGKPYEEQKEIKNLILIGNHSDTALSKFKGKIDLLICIGNGFMRMSDLNDPDRDVLDIDKIVLVNNSIAQRNVSFQSAYANKAVVYNNQSFTNSVHPSDFINRFSRLNQKVDRRITKKIVKLALQIDKHDTDQMLSQVYKISEEMDKIR